FELRVVHIDHHASYHDRSAFFQTHSSLESRCPLQTHTILEETRRTLNHGIGGMLAGSHKTKVLKIKLGENGKVVSSSEDILKAGNLVQRAQ
ncbi:MAG: hypothetical protein M1297_08970, partial [Nitrospirae bacterium]|nr:hypothetical protein [Nitrospirota bacterium]